MSSTNTFCSMCYKAGRAGFNTHFVRESADPKSKVTCPFLLALECRYCKNAGHTKNYCPVLKAKIEREKAVMSEEKHAETQRRQEKIALGEFVNPTRARRAPQTGHTSSPVNGRPPTSRFGALRVDDDSDVECGDAETQPEEEFPELPTIPWGQSTRVAGAWGE